VTERPSTVTAKIRHALTRDRGLPARALAEKAIRFAAGSALAPVFLRDCDEVGARVRTFGRLAVRNFGRIAVGADAIINSIPSPVRLSTAPHGAIEIGHHCILNYGVAIGSDSRVVVGDRVALGPYVHISDNREHSHARDPVVIGDDAWLTVRVCVRGGVRIGAGTIVTAGSVVCDDLPEWVVAGGVPARVIKARDPALREAARNTSNAGLSRLHQLVRYGGRVFEGAGAAWELRAVDGRGPEARVRGSLRIQNLGVMTIGARVRIHSFPETSHLGTGPSGCLVLGDDVSIGCGAAIDAEKEVYIGRRVFMGDGVMIMDTNFHGTADFMAASETAPIRVDDDVTIGDHVTILKGTTIGRGARIADGSVVSGAIAPGVFAAGVIARAVVGKAGTVEVDRRA
jgi:maltose O-acetyltransferase